MCDKVELRYGNRNDHRVPTFNDIRTALDIKEPFQRTLNIATNKTSLEEFIYMTIMRNLQI